MSGVLSEQQRMTWYFDEANDLCISSTAAVLTYTAITYLTVMFFIIGNQVTNTRRKELERMHEDFINRETT